MRPDREGGAIASVLLWPQAKEWRELGMFLGGLHFSRGGGGCGLLGASK
jgi:hypothetical protein